MCSAWLYAALNTRIGEISAAMGDLGKLESNEYSIQRFR